MRHFRPLLCFFPSRWTRASMKWTPLVLNVSWSRDVVWTSISQPLSCLGLIIIRLAASNPCYTLCANLVLIKISSITFICPIHTADATHLSSWVASASTVWTKLVTTTADGCVHAATWRNSTSCSQICSDSSKLSPTIVANSVHTADATQLDSSVASASAV